MMQPLKEGDKVALVSPASVIYPDYVAGACDTLRRWGLRPEVMPHTLSEHGSFSATAEERAADMARALLDPEVRAVFCSRGGYGCVHLLPELDRIMQLPEVAANPKWLIGFSDVTALHGLWQRHGWQSVHASMTKQLTLGGPDDPLNLLLLSILRGEKPLVELPLNFSGSEYSAGKSIPGEAEGVVTGGNMAVLGGLVGTPFCPVAPGSILLIEDIAEPIYKVERILWQLRLAGIFDTLAGVIVGQFTDYRYPSRDHADMYEMITRFIGRSSRRIPVAMDVPVGHIDGNVPVILNAPLRMTVSENSATLSFPENP